MTLHYRGRGSSAESRNIKGGYTLAAGLFSLVTPKNNSTAGGSIIIFIFIYYLVNKYIIQPYLSAEAYLGQFFGDTATALPTELSFPAIPAFIVLVFVAITASFFVWLISRFNQFPNYASRAILGLTIALIVITDHFYYYVLEALGPMTMGYGNLFPFIMMALLYGLLSWVYFSASCSFKFRSNRLDNKSMGMSTHPIDIENKKIAISAYLNRRINTGFFIMLIGFAVFDPNFWFDTTIYKSFWGNIEFLAQYEPLEHQYIASQTATPSVILHTIATYLFMAYFVITLQVRAALRLDNKEGYAGYIPPYYVYGLAVTGTFCAVVFAFVPYEYIGKENATWQAIPPILYFSISLFRTGWQYAGFLKSIDITRKSFVKDFNARKYFFIYFLTVVSIVIIGIIYMSFYGLNLTYSNEEIRSAINQNLPRTATYKKKSFVWGDHGIVFQEVTMLKIYPYNRPYKTMSLLDNEFEMKVQTEVKVSRSYGKVKGLVTFKGRVYMNKNDSVELRNIRFVDADFKLEKNHKDKVNYRLKDAGKRSFKFDQLNLYLFPEIVYSIVRNAELANDGIKIEIGFD